MKVIYLNNDSSMKTGAGRFYNSLTGALGKNVPDLKAEILTHENGLPKRFWQLPFYYFPVRKTIKNCEIVHALDGWPYGFIAVIASLFLKKRVIITAIGTGSVKPLYNWWKRPLLRWAYKKADIVTAVSNNTKKEILKVLPDLNIEVINHGVDFNKFKIKNLKLKIQKPYILSVGALKKRKGFEYSIAAFAELLKGIRESGNKELSDLKYVIVGKGPEHQNLKFKIKNLKLENRVIFLENLTEEELISVYKNAELFVLLPQDINKDIEGFGLVFLEAAAAGLPVVGAKDTSAEDAVRDGKNGILVDPTDIQSAAQAAEKILSDVDLRNSFSKESLILAKEMSWEKIAKTYSDLYFFRRPSI